MLATTISQAIRSVGVSTRRVDNGRSNARMMATQSRWSNHSSPNALPACGITTKASRGDSYCDCMPTTECGEHADTCDGRRDRRALLRGAVGGAVALTGLGVDALPAAASPAATGTRRVGPYRRARQRTSWS